MKGGGQSRWGWVQGRILDLSGQFCRDSCSQIQWPRRPRPWWNKWLLCRWAKPDGGTLEVLSLFWGGHYSLFAQRLFLLHLSVNSSNRSVLDSCLLFPLILSSSQSSHMSTRWFFFEPPDFFNLCKAGISWTPRNVVSFLFIYPQNKTPSSRQSSGPRRTASSSVSSLSALLLCICGLQAQVRIKVFICFTVGSHGFFFPPTVAGSYPTAGVSVRSSQCLAEVGDAEI